MNFMDEARDVARRDGEAAGRRFVTERAAAGDPQALLTIGHWHLFGVQGPRDPTAGRAAIARAAGLGDVEARLAEVALTANGVAAEPDPDRARVLLRAIDHPEAALQCRLIDAMTDAVPTAEIIREAPRIARIRGLWSAAECAHVIERATPRLRPSWVVDPRTGARTPHPVRTSDGTNFGPLEEDLALHELTERIARVTGTDWRQGEPLHVLRYAAGQEYRWHLDALPGVANQRILTVLVYLSDEFDGGMTAFEGGVTVRGEIGDAVVFDNVDTAGRADPRTRHAGMPVTAGTKWLATRWIRARPIDPFRPETMI